MIRKQNHTSQVQLFNGLGEQLNQKHPLYILSNKINWAHFDNLFEPLYSEKMGAPAKPIRLMVSLLILKFVRNLSDESVVEHWSENIYYQYFSGVQFFQPKEPCSSTELVVFRNRIGEPGMEEIFKESIRVNENENDGDFGKTISVDTTVQEKNITYPTDDKLHKKIIQKCISIAEKEGLVLHQTYSKELKKLSTLQRFKKRKNGFKIARKANKRVKTIAGRLVRDLERKLYTQSITDYTEELEICHKVIAQKRGGSNKVYSLHEPEVKCYAKGKDHKKFEFGSKVSIALCQDSGIILSAVNFTETIHDSKTIPNVLEQIHRLEIAMPESVFADRGYVGKTEYGNTKIFTPKPNVNITNEQRKRHSKRAGIEPIIGHLKRNYRLGRNFLKGIFGDIANVLLAAAAMNFKRVMNLWKKEAKLIWQLFWIYVQMFTNFSMPKH
jgi:transposase, IS5 family